MFYFHILYLNGNEWASVKGCILVYLNVNEWVPVKGCILGIWTDGPYGVNTTSVETLDGL